LGHALIFTYNEDKGMVDQDYVVAKDSEELEKRFKEYCKNPKTNTFGQIETFESYLKYSHGCY
jgi:hypothetical protein